MNRVSCLYRKQNQQDRYYLTQSLIIFQLKRVSALLLMYNLEPRSDLDREVCELKD